MELFERIEYWSKVAIDKSWSFKWTPGAIFAREMVYYLAMLDIAKPTYIIESGRQDGYSTRILDYYCRHMSINCSSIDIEECPKRARICRETFSLASRINLIKGNAFIDFPRVVESKKHNDIAVLFDGPKGVDACKLIFKYAEFINVIAIHNVYRGSKEYGIFETYGDKFSFISPTIEGFYWEQLRDIDNKYCNIQEERDPLNPSLAVLRVTDSNRNDLLSCFK